MQPYHAFERLISLFVMPKGGFELSHEIPFAGFLLTAHLMLDNFTQIRYGLFILTRVDIIIGISVIPFLTRAPMQRIAVHLGYNVLGIVKPILLDIAFRQPCPRPTVYRRLGGIKTAHVRERRRGFVERAFHKLRTPHQQPRLPQEWIIFPAVKPLYVFICFLPTFRPLRPPFYAVKTDCLLAFLYGAVEIGSPEVAAVSVPDGIKRQHLCEIILVAGFFLKRAVDVCQRTIIISIITGVERMPPTALRRILLGRTAYGRHYENDSQQGNYMFSKLYTHFVSAKATTPSYNKLTNCGFIA